ncbi:hypothetical protein Hte_004970 [Hypoxylon texense]
MEKVTGKVTEKVERVTRFLKFPKGKENQKSQPSDPPSSRDQASSSQGQRADINNPKLANDDGPTTLTNIEQEVQRESQSHSPEHEIEGDIVKPVVDLETAGAGSSELAAHSLRKEIDEPTTRQSKPDLEQPTPTNPAKSENHTFSQPAAEIPTNLSDLLWDEAYDEVKREHSDMVAWYEQTLSAKLGQTEETEMTPLTPSSPFGPLESHINQTHRESRGIRMKEILESWLCEVDDEDEREDGDKDDYDTEENPDVITYRKIILNAVESTRPNALLGWVGLCFASRILLNPKPSSKEDRLGLIHVISRMDWYGRLPKILSQDMYTDDMQYELKRRIIHLYKAILSYEMNILCSHGGTLAFYFPRNIFKPREPKSISLQAIVDAENALPLFNEKVVHLPLRRRISFAEKAMMRSIVADDYASESESERSSDEPLNAINEMLGDLHVGSPSPAAEDDQDIQDIYGALHARTEYTDFCNWEKGDCRLLWIRGSAGQGKTMLMKSIVQEISRASPSDSMPQCHSFFFDYRTPEADNPAAALRNLIWSILVRQRHLAKHLAHKRDTTNRTTFSDPTDFFALSGVLYSMIEDEDFPKTYFILDALDECFEGGGSPGATDLVNFIRCSIKIPSKRVRWLVSSDFSDTIQPAFCQCSATIDLGSLNCPKTIETFINKKVGVLAEANGYDEDLKSIIAEALCKRLLGNYLQVTLICEALRSEEKWYAERVLDETRTLTELVPLYEYLKSKLTHLPRDDGKFCLDILSTLAVINRSLHLSELKDLVTLKPRVDLHSIVKNCNCFLSFADDNTVSFHHQSIRNYMRQEVHSVSQSYAKLTQRSIDSLAKVLSAGDNLDDELPQNIRFISLRWIEYFYEMIKELVDSKGLGNKLELDPTTSEGVLSFLGDRLVVWLRALSLGGQLTRAAILLQEVNFLLNSKMDETNELTAAIRDARLIMLFHTSTKTPKYVSAGNTMLFCPTESILRAKYLRNSFPHIEVLSLGNTVWRRDFGLLEGHTDWVRSIAFSIDGRLIASGSDDGSVRIWDTKTGTTQHTLTMDLGWVYCVAFSSKGYIAAGSDDDSVTIWDSSTGCQIHKLKDLHGRPYALAFSPDGEYLAVGSTQALRIWGFDIDTQLKELHNIKHHDGYIRSISFSYDGRLLAAGSDDHIIRIWDSWQEANSDRGPHILKGHTGQVSSLAFSPGTRPGYLASGSHDGTSKIWDLNKNEFKCILTLMSNNPVHSMSDDLVHSASDNPVHSVSFSTNGLRLASGTNGGAIDLWDAVDGGKLGKMRTNASSVRSVAFSPTDGYLASASSDSNVQLWYTVNNNTTKETYIEPPDVYDPISELTVAPDGQTVAAGHTDGTITLWKINGDGLPTDMLVEHKRKINCLAFSPNGSSLASGSSDCTVRIYDVATRKEQAAFLGHCDWVRSVAWTLDGKYLASGSDDQSVHIYEGNSQTRTWKDVKAVIHSDAAGTYVRAVAFSPSGGKLYLAAGGDNGDIVLWEKMWGEEEETWERRHTIDAHSDHVRSLIFTPDGKRIVSAADDMTLRIWDLETKDFVGEAIRTQVVHTRMRFEKGQETSNYVVTPHGAQPLATRMEPVPDWCPYKYTTDEGGHWITWHDDKVIFFPIASKSKCQTIKTYQTCKVDLCFVGSTGEGAVQKNHVVDAANKLIHEGGCARYDGKEQGLKIGGYYTIDNLRDEIADDMWCRAPKQSMKVQFGKS